MGVWACGGDQPFRAHPPSSVPARIFLHLFESLRAPRCKWFPPLLVGCADEGLEKRMRLHGLGLEFGMKLAAQIPRVAGNLADLDVCQIRCLTRNLQAAGFQRVFIFSVELVAVPVPLTDFAHAVCPLCEAAVGQNAGPSSEPHGAA